MFYFYSFGRHFSPKQQANTEDRSLGKGASTLSATFHLTQMSQGLQVNKITYVQMTFFLKKEQEDGSSDIEREHKIITMHSTLVMPCSDYLEEHMYTTL